MCVITWADVSHIQSHPISIRRIAKHFKRTNIFEMKRIKEKKNHEKNRKKYHKMLLFGYV